MKDVHYPIPHIEDIFVTVKNGGKTRPIESTRIQATFTAKGNYQVNRLFGSKDALSFWERYITQTLSNIHGVCVFFGNVQIQGAIFEERLQRHRKVLSLLEDVGMHIDENKRQFLKTSVKYLGFTITSDGLRKNEDKVEAMTTALKPRNVSELKSSIGLINYYEIFIENLGI